MVVQVKVTKCCRFNKTIVREPGAFGGLDCVDFHVEDRLPEKEHLTTGLCTGNKSHSFDATLFLWRVVIEQQQLKADRSEHARTVVVAPAWCVRNPLSFMLMSLGCALHGFALFGDRDLIMA